MERVRPRSAFGYRQAFYVTSRGGITVPGQIAHIRKMIKCTESSRDVGIPVLSREASSPLWQTF